MIPADLRTAVRDAVDAIPAVDRRAAQSKASFLDAFDRLDAPFDEHADLTHVTGSAIVVGPRGILLHLHKRIGLWLQPGGHVDPGEAPWDAALRETEEETGLVAAHPAGRPMLLHVDVHPAPRGHTHLDLRYLLLADGDPAPPDGESQDVRWFPEEAVMAIADEGLAGALVALRREFGDAVLG